MTARGTGGNRLRPGAKFDEPTYLRLVYCFCNGVPVAIASRSTGLSAKTVRGLYIELRGRLLEPAFNRWHGTNRRLINLPTREWEEVLRAGYFDLLARCANNQTCARNWRLGNRKARQCRSCPLGGVWADEQHAEAYTIIDTVHRFYEALGIRGEKGTSPVMLFRERLIHATVVATAQNHSQKLANGFFDPKERKFKSGGSLLSMLAGE